jgi:hypothetical protein
MKSFLEPFKDSLIFKILLAIMMFLFTWITNGQVDRTSELYRTLKGKDSIIFEGAFNRCELDKLEPIIAINFEFYHDITGIQNRKEFIAAVKNNICTNPGNFRRQLVEKSLTVFPLKKNGVLYGAIQKGKHKFQEKSKDKNEMKTSGIADFTHLWVLKNNSWKLKRVLSYNHKSFSE